MSKIYAVCVVKREDTLCESFALTIENDRVIAVSPLTRAQDLPAVAIGLAQRDLWAQMRINREVPSVKSKG